MRLTSFNVENFFARAKALNNQSWAAGRPVLEAHAKLNALLEHPVYSAADKARMLVLLDDLGLSQSDSAEMAVLRQVRGRLLKRPRSGLRSSLVVEAPGSVGSTSPPSRSPRPRSPTRPA